MANGNMGKARQLANFYGIQCQLVEGKSPKNCKAVIYRGKSYPTANWTGIDFDSFFSQIASGCEVSADSKAQMKVSEAHGRDDDERMEHFLLQYMTYADATENISMEGSLTDTFNQIIDNRYSNYAEWIEILPHWHANAEKVMQDLINTKQVLILDNKVYSRDTFTKCFRAWIDRHNRKDLKAVENHAIDMYFDRIKTAELV